MGKAETFDSYWTTPVEPDAGMDRVTLVMAARSMIVARRALEGPLPVDLIADPVVDVLMALFVAQADDRAPSAAELERATSVSPIVTQRWLAALEGEALIARDADGVSLTPIGDARVAGAIEAVIRSQISLHADA